LLGQPEAAMAVSLFHYQILDHDMDIFGTHLEDLSILEVTNVCQFQGNAQDRILSSPCSIAMLLLSSSTEAKTLLVYEYSIVESLALLPIREVLNRAGLASWATLRLHAAQMP
jgi:hypothetical protein